MLTHGDAPAGSARGLTGTGCPRCRKSRAKILLQSAPCCRASSNARNVQQQLSMHHGTLPHEQDPPLPNTRRAWFKAIFIERTLELRREGAGGVRRCRGAQPGSLHSLLARHLVGVALEELVAHHGHAGQEGGILVEVHLVVPVAVQVAHQLLEAGLVRLFLPSGKRGQNEVFASRGASPGSPGRGTPGPGAAAPHLR